jgi:hypothetical protein
MRRICTSPPPPTRHPWCGVGVLCEPGSAARLVSGYRLDDRAIEVRSPAEEKDFSLVSVSRPAQRPTQPPVQRVLGSFPRAKALQGRDVDDSHPYSAEVDSE